MQPVEIALTHIAGDVHAVEDRALEILNARIALAGAAQQFIEILIDQPVRADKLHDLVDAAPVRDEFPARGHIDAVHIGVAHRRRRRGEVYPGRARIARHLNDFAGRGAAHDGIVHQHDPAPLELQADRVELLAHRAAPLLLPGHDKRAPYIAVFDKRLAVLDAQRRGQRKTRRAAGVRHGDDHVDVVPGSLALNFSRQGFALALARFVHGNFVDQAIRAREVNVLENTRPQPRRRGALIGVQAALGVDVHRLTGGHIAQAAKAQNVQGHALGSHHVFALRVLAAIADHQRTDTVRIAKGEHPVIDEHGHGRIPAATAPVHRRHRGEQIDRPRV